MPHPTPWQGLWWLRVLVNCSEVQCVGKFFGIQRTLGVVDSGWPCKTPWTPFSSHATSEVSQPSRYGLATERWQSWFLTVFVELISFKFQVTFPDMDCWSITGPSAAGGGFCMNHQQSTVNMVDSIMQLKQPDKALEQTWSSVMRSSARWRKATLHRDYDGENGEKQVRKTAWETKGLSWFILFMKKTTPASGSHRFASFFAIAPLESVGPASIWPIYILVFNFISQLAYLPLSFFIFSGIVKFACFRCLFTLSCFLALSFVFVRVPGSVQAVSGIWPQLCWMRCGKRISAWAASPWTQSWVLVRRQDWMTLKKVRRWVKSQRGMVLTTLGTVSLEHMHGRDFDSLTLRCARKNWMLSQERKFSNTVNML